MLIKLGLATKLLILKTFLLLSLPLWRGAIKIEPKEEIHPK